MSFSIPPLVKLPRRNPRRMKKVNTPESLQSGSAGEPAKVNTPGPPPSCCLTDCTEPATGTVRIDVGAYMNEAGAEASLIVCAGHLRMCQSGEIIAFDWTPRYAETEAQTQAAFDRLSTALARKGAK
jgi:hypothetical protein